MSEEREKATFDLAVVRTELSNSRTLLSYAQASITLLLTGIALMKLFDYSLALYLCCWLLIALAVAVIARGIFLYRKTKTLIEKQKQLSSIRS